MGTITGAVLRVVRSGRGLLASGQPLTPEVWERRHGGIVWLLWAHVAGPGRLRRGPAATGWSTGCRRRPWWRCSPCRPRIRPSPAVLGLITASAVLVHRSGGVVEAHFHFFVMIGVITLYQDWLPFGLALAYVVVHHTVLGALAPAQVFNHPAPSGPRSSGP